MYLTVYNRSNDKYYRMDMRRRIILPQVQKEKITFSGSEENDTE